MPLSTIRTRFWPMLRVLAASTALVACHAQAQYSGGRPAIGLPPSVELNLDVLTKLRPAPVQEMRKVPSEQPYTPPVRLPVASTPSPSITGRSMPASPFARGESNANILSDVSSANYAPEVKKPAPKPAPVRPAIAAPKPAPVPPPVPARAPAPAPVVPVAPKPPAPAIIPPAAPVAAPVTAAQPMSVVPPVNTAPMMIPVKPRPAPLPIIPNEVPVQPAPVVSPPVIKPVAPAVVPPAPLPTGNVPLAPAPVVPPPAAPAIVPPAAMPAPVTPPKPVVNNVPKPAPVSSAIPPMIPVTAATKPALNVPPPPSLDGLDFSNMKAGDPDGLGDLTPQKLLGKPVETMVVAKPSTLPEIEVPAATATEKLPTVTKEKPADGMLPSISNRMDKLFTKDNVKMGMQSDTTRVINPVADKQKELAAKAESEKAASEKAAAPKLPEVGGLPPLPLPASAPKEKSIKIAGAAPEHTLKVKNDTPPAGLPSLDAITGTKAPESSMDVIQPKDGIIASETMPPATLPEPVPALPVVKKEALPKVVVEEKKPAKPPVKEAVKEAPKPPAPLAIAPKEKPSIKEDTKIAALPPLPDFASGVKKPDPALAPALPQLPPPAKLEAKKPEPVKEAPAKIEPIKPPEVEVKAPEPKAQPIKPAAPLNVPKPPSGGSGKASATVGFGKDATDLSADAKTELMGLADSIKKNDSSVRIVAYAQGSEDEASIARRISLSRALQVRAFLIDKGVNQLKINVQALGHKVPSGSADRADVVVY